MLVWIILEVNEKVCALQDVDSDLYWANVGLYNTRYIDTVDGLAWKLLMLNHPFKSF